MPKHILDPPLVILIHHNCMVLDRPTDRIVMEMSNNNKPSANEIDMTLILWDGQSGYNGFKSLIWA